MLVRVQPQVLMNIFYLSNSARDSARMLADIHVGSKNTGGKMIVESTQMLTNCYPLEILENAPKTQKGAVRKYSYYNHRCSKWVRESYENFEWLLNHALEMIQEKLYRGGRLHFCNTFLHWATDNKPELPHIGFTTPALAMPDQYKCNDPVKSYRDYYWFDKRVSIKTVWTRRDPPDWWKERLNHES